MPQAPFDGRHSPIFIVFLIGPVEPPILLLFDNMPLLLCLSVFFNCLDGLALFVY